MFVLIIWFSYAPFKYNIALGSEKNELMEKWKRAVVHLECADDVVPLEKYLKSKDELKSKFDKGELSREEYDKAVEEFERKWEKGLAGIRSFGTAIFMEYNQRRYLITARHVLHDETAIPKRDDAIYYRIFRAHSPDDLPTQEGKIATPILFNLGVGPPKSRAYTFSSPSKDLAIISLDCRMIKKLYKTAELLLSLGHVPITINDIIDEPSTEGAEVFSVGYPRASILKELRWNKSGHLIKSTVLSLPMFFFGRVSMLNDKLIYFICDISTYPGCSGGPIVENGKLAGIVIKQSWTQTKIFNTGSGEEEPLVGVSRVPYTTATKAKFIKELLQVQIKKDLIEMNPISQN